MPQFAETFSLWSYRKHARYWSYLIAFRQMEIRGSERTVSFLRTLKCPDRMAVREQVPNGGANCAVNAAEKRTDFPVFLSARVWLSHSINCKFWLGFTSGVCCRLSKRKLPRPVARTSAREIGIYGYSVKKERELKNKERSRIDLTILLVLYRYHGTPQEKNRYFTNIEGRTTDIFFNFSCPKKYYVKYSSLFDVEMFEECILCIMLYLRYNR